MLKLLCFQLFSMSDKETEEEKDIPLKAEMSPLQTIAKVKMRKFGFMGSLSMLNPSTTGSHSSLLPELRKRSKSAINLGKIFRKNSLNSLKVRDDIYIKDSNRDSGVVVENHEVAIDEKTLNELRERKKTKLNELLDTEERYFGDLLKMSNMFTEMKKSTEDPDYPIQMPEDLQRIFSVFSGNFHQIRDYHKEMFTDRMRSTIWRADLMRDLFRKNQYVMKSIYGKYCSNWKISKVKENKITLVITEKTR